MKTKKTTRAPLIFLSLLALLGSSTVLAQGGAGSKGGVVMACFKSDPRKFLLRAPNVSADLDIWVWPVVSDSAEDSRISDASKALLFDAVNQLDYVELDEYRAVTDKSWGGREDLFSDRHYRLHPLLFLIRQLARQAMPAPVINRILIAQSNGMVVPFPREKLLNPASLTADEAQLVSSYVYEEERRLADYRDKSMPVFTQIYGLVAEMFRGVPGFYTRLSAAHDLVGPISNHESNISGNSSDQWDSRNISALSNPPYDDRKCIKMTAADRVTDKHDPSKTTMIYDRYLWHRMDLFQRVLLQLHEEFYYMGSDAKNLGLAHTNAEPTRYLLARFLRGDRMQNESGEFASVCASYDTSVNARSPVVKLLDSAECTAVKTVDRNFIPASLIGADAYQFASQFLCSGDGCSPALTELWQKIAVAYGPYSATKLKGLLASASFGTYSTIDKLLEQRDSEVLPVANSSLQAYKLLNRFCNAAGYGSVPSPAPDPNNARRLPKGKRHGADSSEMTVETAALHDVQKKYNGTEFQTLYTEVTSQLLTDFPDLLLTNRIGDLTKLGLPANLAKLSDLEPGKKGKDAPPLDQACNEVRERTPRLQQFVDFLSGPSKISFYENSWPALDTQVNR